jgi:predicted PurR-regulated permease PerM
MRTFLIILSATLILFTASSGTIAAQQSTDIQKEIDLIKKTDKKMQYSVNKCAKDMKALNQKMDENLKNLNTQTASLKTNLDTLDNHFNAFKADVTKKQDQLTSKAKTLSIMLWLCVIVLLIIIVSVYFALSGAVKKLRTSFEAKMLNDKEAFELAIKKTDKELNDKLHLLEQQIATFKK